MPTRRSLGTYIEPQGLGGYTPDFGISGADREGNTLVLVVDQYTDQNKIFHTSVLTIQLESEDTTETEDAEETEETTGGGRGHLHHLEIPLQPDHLRQPGSLGIIWTGRA